jgi:hypothetical protein
MSGDFRTKMRAIGSIYFIATDLNPLKKASLTDECRKYDTIYEANFNMCRTGGSQFGRLFSTD